MIKNFSAVLKELRTKANLLQSDIADACKISVRTIIRYENDERIPDIDTAIKLADYFNVSLDYLVGRSDNPKRF